MTITSKNRPWAYGPGTMRRCLLTICVILGCPTHSFSQTTSLEPVRIASPNNAHIHPAVCVSKRGTLTVICGRVCHTELGVTHSSDGGRTWTMATAFDHTIDKAHYPGSLTALEDSRILHAWNRWSGETNQREPRSVLYALSSDEGRTWNTPKSLPRDPLLNCIIRHPIVELAPDRWLFSLSDKTFVYDPTTGSGTPLGDGHVHGLVPLVRTPRGTYVSGQGLRSTDDGKTCPFLPESFW